jgi:phytanoyl-CoA hydroxylase
MDKDTYDQYGYVIYPRLFSRELIDEANRIIDELDLKPCDTVFDEDGTGKIKQIQYLHKYHEFFANMIETLRPYAVKLTGQKDLKVLNMQMFEKHPDISKPTRAHQDNAYFKVTPPLAITFWISLDHIDEENGALYYAPKTHLTPTRKHARYHKDTTFRIRSGVPGLSLCLHEHPEETDIPIITEPGDVLVHHCNTIHRAGKNTSSRRRRAIGIVFIPEICTEDPRLVKYHNDRLREDIDLQKIKNPARYRELKKQFSYLYENNESEQ